LVTVAEKFISLADYLGLEPGTPANPEPDERQALERLTGKDFAQAVLDSLEFRRYILDGLRFSSIPAAVLCRLMDHGWGKAPDRVEHTGKDGEPIVTEVRRVVIHLSPSAEPDQDSPSVAKVTTH
jgi:hypothetical protein